MEERKVYPVVAADYKLLEEVGQGVSAVVYRAVCLPFNEVVAIKSLDLEKCSSNLDEIRREAQMMCLINHPNVVRAYCSFVVEHSLWVVMPYMAGGSCLHIMKSAFPDGFEEAVIATVLKEVLKALDYLHRHGHIHRDVKAGNILIDANGAVKLGDFGVSACLFDTGDRQRARITFVGTPCWMAPEVMEQLHGYDFKADIWSFGITALELAHGHAPFSKYPPMKVLLMTLQNAPPGLDYERDKRFSKSFKEMIAMCLVKDPQKRPTADKLLKHSFFKGAKSGEYLVRNVLSGLPPLWERVKNLKLTDAARLAQKKMPFGEQEEMSQKEYKRAVSSWNFDLEDLKAQAALIGNEDDICIDKEEEPKQPEATEIHREIASKAPSAFSSDVSEVHSVAVDQLQAPQASLGKHDDVLANGRTPFTRSVGSPSSSHSKPATAVKHAHGMLPPTRKEPKHIGRFDVFEDDNDVSPSFHESLKPKFEESIQRNENGLRKTEEKEAHGEREKRHPEEREIDDHRRASSGPLIAERVLSSYRSRDDEKERPCGPCPQRASFSGPLTSSGATLESRPANGAPSSLRPPAGNKDGGDDKMKGTLVRGRFRVTPDHTMASEDAFLASGPRRTSSVQSLAQLPSTVPQQSYQPPSSNGLPAVPVASLFPQLQSLLHQTEMQQDIIMNLMCNMNQGEGYGGQKLCVQPSRNVPRPECQGEGMSDRERELLQQVSELKSRVVMLVEELASVKTRNVQLERQLNAIYNKEEEEKIRREEAAKDV